MATTLLLFVASATALGRTRAPPIRINSIISSRPISCTSRSDFRRVVPPRLHASQHQVSSPVPRILGLEELLHSSDATVEIQGQVLFDAIRAEAIECAHSPVIGPWVNRTVLSAKDLPDAMARILASHVAGAAGSMFVEGAVQELLCAVSAESRQVRRGVVTDLTKAIEADFAVESLLQPFLHFKGLHVVSLSRIASKLWRMGGNANKHTALALQSHGSMTYGVDIHPMAKLGEGIFVDHATGLVIGSTAIVGNDVMILHGVTLGATGKRVEGKRHPTVGDGTVLGALSTVLGDVSIGRKATVGAQAVVTKNVEDGETVVGINKVLSASRKSAELAKGGDEGNWFYQI